MATLSPTSTHPQRAPPPTLFQGPPSRNASNISLSPPAPPPPPQSSTSSQPRPQTLRAHSTLLPDPTASSNLRSRPQLSTTKTENDRADAQWIEMQARLADVEVSAFHSTHLFGPAHSAALEELRTSQIELAKAWGRGVGGEDGDDGGIRDEEKRENDEEEDLVVARRRREANEKYFARVKEGVEGVVGKLEEMAEAMAKVEKESMDIWGGNENPDSGSRSARE